MIIVCQNIYRLMTLWIAFKAVHKVIYTSQAISIKDAWKLYYQAHHAVFDFPVI